MRGRPSSVELEGLAERSKARRASFAYVVADLPSYLCRWTRTSQSRRVRRAADGYNSRLERRVKQVSSECSVGADGHPNTCRYWWSRARRCRRQRCGRGRRHSQDGRPDANCNLPPNTTIGVCESSQTQHRLLALTASLPYTRRPQQHAQLQPYLFARPLGSGFLCVCAILRRELDSRKKSQNARRSQSNRSSFGRMTRGHGW